MGVCWAQVVALCAWMDVDFVLLLGLWLLFFREEKEHGLDMSESYVLYGVFGVAERNVLSRHVLYRVFGVANRSV